MTHIVALHHLPQRVAPAIHQPGVRDIRDGVKPTFFADAATEKLFDVVVALAAEVSVLRERVLRLENTSSPNTPSPVDMTREAEDFIRHVFGGLAS
jgi:hypothetical protein